MIEYCQQQNLKLVVVTHYCPSYKLLHPSKSEDKYASLYVSHLDYLLNKNDIHTYICGHTHYNFDFKTNGGTRLVSNQLGKPRDGITDYLKNFVVTV